MKILIKECKKIMDIRVLLVIAVFTVLFYHLFLELFRIFINILFIESRHLITTSPPYNSQLGQEKI